jgi:high-affinity iron transporter
MRWALLAVLAAGCRQPPPPPAPIEPPVAEAARRIASRLEYVAANYPRTVKGGALVLEPEHRAQLAMLEEARALAAQIPDGADLTARIESLAAALAAAAGEDEVPAEAAAASAALVADSGLRLAPLAAADRERARALFRENCARCHGPGGAGDGPRALELAIRPRSLTDPDVMEDMSPARIYNTLSDGIPVADMPSFELLSPPDRWSLAFYAMSLRFVGPDGGAAGERPAEIEVPDRAALAAATDRELRERLGAAGLTWARTAAAFEPPAGALAPLETALAEAIDLHRRGERVEAAARLDAAMAEAFAPFRPGLVARDRVGAWRLEAALHRLRAELPEGASLSLEQQALAAALAIAAAEDELAMSSPVAMAALVALASLGWIAVVLATGLAAARRWGVAGAGRAVHIGWAIAAAAGAGTLLLASGEVDLAAASQRHQITALLRFATAGGGLAVAIAAMRRLAAPIPSGTDAGTPWWLAVAAFVAGYGGASEAAHHLARIATATGASRLALLAAAAAAIAAVAGLLALAGRAARRGGEAASLTLVAAAAIVAAAALAAHGARVLIDGGTLAAAPRLGLRFDPVGLYPYPAAALAQLIAAGLAAVAAVAAVVAALTRRSTDRRE